MKKSVLLNLSLLSIGLTVAVNAGAQGTLASDAEVMGARFIVNAPMSISGVKDFTFSSDGTTPWGGSLNTPVENVEVVKASDSEACTSISPVAAGKWVLIYRGNCEFGVKAKNAETAGAAGVIIWNHTPNELINMGAGAVGATVTIPVTFISNEDGRAMTNQLSSGNQVMISVSKWGFGKTHDLAIVPGTPAPPPGLAVPLNQFDAADIPQYRGYVGGYVANTGTSTENNVKLIANVSWTPTSGGPATPYYSDTATIATFPITDSIKYDVFSPDHFNFAPSSTGRYDFNYSVVADDNDGFTFDNTHNFSLNITPNAFNRGRINVQTQEPIVSGFTRLGDATASLTWGPLFYVKKGGYHMSHVIFSVADQDTSDHDLTDRNDGLVEVFVFKWTDGSNGGPADERMQSEELTIKGIAVKKFATTDSNRTMLTAYIGDAVNGAPAQIVSESNSYYWFATNLNTVFALSSDRTVNYHARTAAAMKYATSKTPDFWAPAFIGSATDIVQNPGTPIRMFPFGFPTSNIDSLTVPNGSAVPAMTFIQGVFQVGVKETAKASADQFSVYPNPAVSNITAKVGLVSATEKLHIKIIDGLGRQVYSEVRKNVQNAEVTLPVGNYPAGNYYMIMISDNNAMSRPFTVVGK